jgi:hypothetical protein
MKIKITSQNKKDYLLIISKGTLSVTEDLFEHAEMIYVEISKYKQNKILIEESKTVFPQSLFAYSDLVKFYEKLPPESRQLRIAAVIPNLTKKLLNSGRRHVPTEALSSGPSLL